MRAFLDTDGLLVVHGVKDEADLEYVSDAVVSVIMYHRETGVEIAGVVWPLTLIYVALSEGRYQGVLPRAAAVAEGQTCELKIVMEKDGFQTTSWDRVTYAKKRALTP